MPDTRKKKHEEKLTTDFTGFTDLFGHKKAQKTRRKLDADFAGYAEFF
jgi:hypothetical protein